MVDLSGDSQGESLPLGANSLKERAMEDSAKPLLQPQQPAAARTEAAPLSESVVDSDVCNLRSGEGAGHTAAAAADNPLGSVRLAAVRSVDGDEDERSRTHRLSPQLSLESSSALPEVPNTTATMTVAGPSESPPPDLLENMPLVKPPLVKPQDDLTDKDGIGIGGIPAAHELGDGGRGMTSHSQAMNQAGGHASSTNIVESVRGHNNDPVHSFSGGIHGGRAMNPSMSNIISMEKPSAVASGQVPRTVSAAQVGVLDVIVSSSSDP